MAIFDAITTTGPVHLFVHVTRYRGEPRDDYGEAMELRAGKDGRPQAMVRLFAREGEKHQWRNFKVDDVEVEP